MRISDFFFQSILKQPQNFNYNVSNCFDSPTMTHSETISEIPFCSRYKFQQVPILKVHKTRGRRIRVLFALFTTVV
jgi:hypothetical protein